MHESYCAQSLALGTMMHPPLCRHRDLDRRDFQRIEHLLRKVECVAQMLVFTTCTATSLDWHLNAGQAGYVRACRPHIGVPIDTHLSQPEMHSFRQYVLLIVR